MIIEENDKFAKKSISYIYLVGTVVNMYKEVTISGTRTFVI